MSLLFVIFANLLKLLLLFEFRKFLVVNHLNTQVERMKLDVTTLAPVHGEPVAWNAFVAALNSLERAN